jgi:hypothetical protein
MVALVSRDPEIVHGKSNHRSEEKKSSRQEYHQMTFDLSAFSSRVFGAGRKQFPEARHARRRTNVKDPCSYEKYRNFDEQQVAYYPYARGLDPSEEWQKCDRHISSEE